MTLFGNKQKTILRPIWFLIVLTGFYGCDVLESDVAPETPAVEITGNEIYMIQNGTGVIDLNAMVKSAGSVRLDITGQPRKGDLSEVSTGILQYSPNAQFKKGRDFFEFSVYSLDNNLLKRDSIIIIVESDTTNLPCGIYPQNDFVFDVSGPTSINVLFNDVLCVDSTQVGVQIYQPSQLPDHGTAVVQSNNNILYTPNNSFTGVDKIMYRVFSLIDTTKFGIGTVYINKTPTCIFDVYNDNYVFNADTLTSRTVRLNVFNNDQLCGIPADSLYTFTMIQDGNIGSAVYQNSGSVPDFAYSFSDTINHTFTDSLIYQLCKDARCRTAKVYIQMNY
jgi:hypothetical protein